MIPEDDWRNQMAVIKSIVNLSFRAGFELFNMKVYQKAENFFRNLEECVQEGRVLCKYYYDQNSEEEVFSGFAEEMNVKDESAKFYLRRIEAYREMERAEDWLKIAMNNDDTLDIELIWDVLDRYKHCENLVNPLVIQHIILNHLFMVLVSAKCFLLTYNYLKLYTMRKQLLQI